MRRATIWRCVRWAGAVSILAGLIWRLGTGPFVDGLRHVSGRAVLAAVALNVVATVCTAHRWRLVAHGLGVGLPLRTAVAAYYRGQFLNTALPGGVLGDVHRGVRHGRDAGDLGRGLRAVVWERGAGQAVQVAIAAIVLVALPSPVRSAMPLVLAVVAVVVGSAVLLLRALARHRSRTAEALRTARDEIRASVLTRTAWPGVLATSVVVVAAHTATFVVAARAAGVDLSLVRLLPVAVLVLLAMTVPTNIGGWGPREGVAAWLFAAAGPGADVGIAAATVYGVLVIAATLPGAVVLLAPRLGRAPRPRRPDRPHARGRSGPARWGAPRAQGGAHG
jgi:uncharacterized membrane protein YbhN (UPF0104 family)